MWYVLSLLMYGYGVLMWFVGFPEEFGEECYGGVEGMGLYVLLLRVAFGW